MTEHTNENQNNEVEIINNETPNNDTPENSLIPHPLYTDFAEVMVHPTVTETSNFQMVLSEIPKRVSTANELLKAYREDPKDFLNTVDEATMDDALKDMAEVSKFMRDIQKSRKEMKSYFDGIRDNLLNVLDERLDEADYQELERAQTDIKQLKKDVDADRRAERWEEIRPTFEANVNRYPLLGQFAPELADFSRFKMLFPKLISGAKTRKVKEADHTTVNDAVYEWNTGIEIMKDNEWDLSPHDLNQLLTMFKQNPSVDMVTREGRQFKINADAKKRALQEEEQRRAEAAKQAALEAERRKVEMERIQEQERIAKQQRDKAAEEQAIKDRAALAERARLAAEQEKARAAQYAAQYDQFGNQYKTIFKESFPHFIAYLFENPGYHDVHSNPQTKASVIYDIMRQVERPDSVVTRETAKSPQKVLDLVRYILDA